MPEEKNGDNISELSFTRSLIKKYIDGGEKLEHSINKFASDIVVLVDKTKIHFDEENNRIRLALEVMGERVNTLCTSLVNRPCALSSERLDRQLEEIEKLLEAEKEKTDKLLKAEKVQLDLCKTCIVAKFEKNYDLILKVIILLACGFVGYEIITKLFKF